MTKADLTRFVKLQIEEAIYHLFTWTRGNFFFEADQVPDADITVSINPDSLLLEAARRVDEWSLIEKKIPSLDLIFEVDRDRVKEAFSELTPEQQRILTLLDGAHTVTDVSEESGMTEFDVGKALFGLIQANFAHRVGKRAASVIRGKESEINERRNLGLAFYHTAMMEEARAEYARVLELAPTDVQSRFYLALDLVARGTAARCRAPAEITARRHGPEVRRVHQPRVRIACVEPADRCAPGFE